MPGKIKRDEKIKPSLPPPRPPGPVTSRNSAAAAAVHLWTEPPAMGATPPCRPVCPVPNGGRESRGLSVFFIVAAKEKKNTVIGHTTDEHPKVRPTDAVRIKVIPVPFKTISYCTGSTRVPCPWQSIEKLKKSNQSCGKNGTVTAVENIEKV